MAGNGIDICASREIWQSLDPSLRSPAVGLEGGESDLLLNIDETPILTTTRAQALRRIQEWAARGVEPGRVVSEELLEERRKEAEEELGN